MMRKLMAEAGIALVGLSLLSLLPGYCVEPEVESHDINGGFEKTVSITKYEDEYRQWGKEGRELPDPFVKAQGWHPQDINECRWNMKIVTDEKEAYSGSNHLQLTSGQVYYYWHGWATIKDLKPGDEVTLSAWVKGPEGNRFQLGLYLYGYNKENKRVNIYNDGDKNGLLVTGKATPEWKQYTGTYVIVAGAGVDVPGATVSRVSPALYSVRSSPTTGEEVWFDNVEVKIKRVGKAGSE